MKFQNVCQRFFSEMKMADGLYLAKMKSCRMIPHFNNYILFHEYFHGDTAKGLGASHQTGWTALIANLLQPFKRKFHEPGKKRTANFNHRVDFF